MQNSKQLLEKFITGLKCQGYDLSDIDLSQSPEATEEFYRKRDEEMQEDIRQDFIKKSKQKVADMFGLQFKNATLDNFEVYDQKQQNVLQACRRFKYNRERGEALVFLGKPGVGKTHLATAICRDYPGRMEIASFEAICDEKVSAQKEGREWRSELKKYTECGLLLLDEFGVRGSFTESQKEVLFHIVNERYMHKRSYVITSNLNASEFCKILDTNASRTLRRVNEATRGLQNVLTMDWTPMHMRGNR